MLFICRAEEAEMLDSSPRRIRLQAASILIEQFSGCAESGLFLIGFLRSSSEEIPKTIRAVLMHMLLFRSSIGELSKAHVQLAAAVVKLILFIVWNHSFP